MKIIGESMKKKNKVVDLIIISFISIFLTYVITYVYTMSIYRVFHPNQNFFEPLSVIFNSKYFNNYLISRLFYKMFVWEVFVILLISIFAICYYFINDEHQTLKWKNTNNNRFGSNKFATTEDVLKWHNDKYTDISLLEVPSYKKYGEKLFSMSIPSGGAVLGKTTPKPTNENAANLKATKEKWIVNYGDLSTYILGASRSGKGIGAINPLLHNLMLSSGKISLNERKDKNIFINPNQMITFDASNIENLKPYFSPWFFQIYQNYKVFDAKEDKKVNFFKRFPIQIENSSEATILDDLNLYINAPNQNILVPDFKGELYKTFGGAYAKKGYNVINLDLINPMESSSFNFLTEIKNSYWDYIDAYYKLKKLKKANEPDVVKITQLEKQFRTSKSLGDTSLRKIGLVLFPTTGNGDSDNWIKWGMEVFTGSIFVTIIEILHKSYKTADEVEQKRLLNSININSCISTYSLHLRGSGMKNYFSATKFCKRNPFVTKEDQFLNDIISFLDQPDTTKANIGKNMSSATNIFTSDVKYCFAKNDFNLDDLVGFIPTAIFIAIPEDETLYKFATLFINLTWNKVRVSVKKMKEKERLPINLNMVLDEFGNLPKIDGILEQLSAGLSMGVKTYIATQSNEQIEKKYGDKDCAVIIDNCRNFIYLENPSYKTRHWVSQRFGNITIEEKIYNSKKHAKDKAYYDTKIVSRPLVTEEELVYENKNRTKFDTLAQYVSKESIYSNSIKYFNFEDEDALRNVTKRLFNAPKPFETFELFDIIITRKVKKLDEYGEEITSKSFVELNSATKDEIEANFETVI